MRYLWAMMALAVAGWFNDATAAGPPLVVHEWGTFTSFADSKGELVQFRPLIDSKLPEFVFTREEQNGSPDLAFAFTKFSVWSKQRMETPVTYFYTDQVREVNVSVDFPQGFLTEFYPPVRTLLPPSYSEGWEMKNARLDWGKVRLIPQEEFDRTIGAAAEKDGRNALPIVLGDNHYGHARGTDSAIVEFDDPQGHGKHYEKFLFYRGTGNFDQPGKLTAQGGGRFVLNNDSDKDLQHLFLVQVEGHKVRYSYSPVAKAGTELAMSIPSELSTIEEVSDALVKALVETGLYEKEAVSMVNTWRSSWLGESGTRVLYTLPQSWTDALIPLKIEPAPEKSLRVMVGRLEIMTPETERDLANLVAADTPENVVANASNNVLGRLGRFGSAAAYHVGASLPTDDLKQRASQIANGLCIEEDNREGRGGVQ